MAPLTALHSVIVLLNPILSDKINRLFNVNCTKPLKYFDDSREKEISAFIFFKNCVKGWISFFLSIYMSIEYSNGRVA